MTNESLRTIATLQKLEVLAMVGCPLVDDVGLQFLENGCPLLQVIDSSPIKFSLILMIVHKTMMQTKCLTMECNLLLCFSSLGKFSVMFVLYGP